MHVYVRVLLHNIVLTLTCPIVMFCLILGQADQPQRGPTEEESWPSRGGVKNQEEDVGVGWGVGTKPHWAHDSDKHQHCEHYEHHTGWVCPDEGIAAQTPVCTPPKQQWTIPWVPTIICPYDTTTHYTSLSAHTCTQSIRIPTYSNTQPSDWKVFIPKSTDARWCGVICTLYIFLLLH